MDSNRSWTTHLEPEAPDMRTDSEKRPNPGPHGCKRSATDRRDGSSLKGNIVQTLTREQSASAHHLFGSPATWQPIKMTRQSSTAAQKCDAIASNNHVHMNLLRALTFNRARRTSRIKTELICVRDVDLLVREGRDRPLGAVVNNKILVTPLGRGKNNGRM